MSRLIARGLSTSARALEAALPPTTTAASTTTAAPTPAPSSSSTPAAVGETFTPSSRVTFENEDNAPEPTKLRPKWTAKGRPQPTRPPRTTRVTLPSGWPEPPSYPPPRSYFREIETLRAQLPEGAVAPKPHPLWAFFHVPPIAKAELGPDSKMPPDCGSLPRMDNESTELSSGRPWTAAELRLKSFEDLHILWYVLLRERNVIATQMAERRRLGISHHYGGKMQTVRRNRCRKSMARIKYVLNERRLGAIAAGAKAQHDEGHQAVPIPFSVKDINDPTAQVEALAGTHPVPKVAEAEIKRIKDKVARARAAAKKAAKAVNEEDMTDAELDALVAQEEAEAKEEEAARQVEGAAKDKN